jgi:hypothetical protein
MSCSDLTVNSTVLTVGDPCVTDKVAVKQILNSGLLLRICGICLRPIKHRLNFALIRIATVHELLYSRDITVRTAGV